MDDIYEAPWEESWSFGIEATLLACSSSHELFSGSTNAGSESSMMSDAALERSEALNSAPICAKSIDAGGRGSLMSLGP
jgi:hypothetical protein